MLQAEHRFVKVSKKHWISPNNFLRYFVVWISSIMLSTPLFAQYQFDFGSSSVIPRDECPVVVLSPIDNFDYYVNVTVEGFVFDTNLEYSRQLSEQSFTQAFVNQTTGYFHINQLGNNPSAPMGDVAANQDELLGCGRYRFEFRADGSLPFEIYLDLTDAKWATATTFRNILFDEPDFNNGKVRIWISVDSPMSTDIIDCGEYGGSTLQGNEAKSWYLVRNHGTAMYYARDLDGFSIDPSYTGPDPSGDQNTDEIPYGISTATTDVYIDVADNIIIPNGKEWVITTDPDGINNPYLEQTKIRFASGKGLTIADGGKLTTEHYSPYGVVDFVPSSGSVGGWSGIRASSGSNVALSATTIQRAVIGLTLADPEDADLSVCLIERSRDIGLYIKDCSSYSNGPLISISTVDSTGEYSGTFNTKNVFVENCTDAPYFYLCGMKNAIKEFDGRSKYSGGHGVEVVNSSEVTFENCVMHSNDSTGVYLHHTNGARLEACNIFSNGKNLSGQGGQVGAGLYIKETKYWTTLQDSRVYYNNSYGIQLYGNATDTTKLRGWYHASINIDPNNPSDVDQISDRNGNNCIYENTYNVGSVQYGRYDLGSAYIDGSGSVITLGGYNTIVNPVMSQGYLYNYSHGGFRKVWWNSDPQIWIYSGSKLDQADSLLADSVNCFEMGKRSIEGTSDLTREILEYRRTRGHAAVQYNVINETEPRVDSPNSCAILSVYPNPFNPSTQITIKVTEAQTLQLKVTDMMGREVALLAAGAYNPGEYTFTCDGRELASGTYLLILRSANSVQTRTILLTK